MDSPKSIIKLVVATFIIILIVILAINIGNKNVKQANNQEKVPIKEIKNNNDEDEELDTDLEPIEDVREDYYDAPDTASSSIGYIIIGTIISSSGILYIHKKN